MHIRHVKQHLTHSKSSISVVIIINDYFQITLQICNQYHLLQGDSVFPQMRLSAPIMAFMCLGNFPS